jgi:hypothetical protein
MNQPFLATALYSREAAEIGLRSFNEAHPESSCKSSGRGNWDCQPVQRAIKTLGLQRQ